MIVDWNMEKTDDKVVWTMKVVENEKSKGSVGKTITITPKWDKDKGCYVFNACKDFMEDLNDVYFKGLWG